MRGIGIESIVECGLEVVWEREPKSFMSEFILRPIVWISLISAVHIVSHDGILLDMDIFYFRFYANIPISDIQVLI